MRLNSSGVKYIAVTMISLAILSPTRVLLADVAPATQPANLEFLQGDAGRAAMIDDALDPYFALLCDHEMTAKTGAAITGDTAAEKIAECKKRYQAGVLDFTEADKRVLSFFVAAIQKPLTEKYPVFGKTPWSLIKTTDELEGGMAYTRGTHIILPQGMLQRFEMMNRRLGDRSVAIGGSLLIHEQTHVLERLQPKVFLPLFTGTLHFVHAGKIQSNPWLDARQLVNPDGTHCDWVYPLTENGKNTYILPMLAFDEPNPTGLTTGIGTIAITMDKTPDGFKPQLDDKGNPVVRPLGEITSYIEGPGDENSNYHPNEIIADRFAELVVIDDLMDAATKKKMMGKGAAKMESRLKPIRDWAKIAFAEPLK